MELYTDKKLPKGWQNRIEGHYEDNRRWINGVRFGEHFRSYTYISWFKMLQRCYSASRFGSEEHYQSRGILVCKRWVEGEDGKHGFLCYLEDMGERPEGHTAGRIGDVGNYVPGNVEWQTPKKQGEERSNKRKRVA